MDAYARPGDQPNTWILIDNDAFTLKGALRSAVVLDADDPGQNTTIVVSDLEYGAGWIQRATPDDLALIGAKKVLPPDSPPAGHLTSQPSLIDFDGDPKWHIDSQPMDIEQARVEARAALASSRWESSQFFTYDGVRTSTGGGMTTLAMRPLLGIDDGDTRVIKLAPGEFREWNKAQEDAFAAGIAAWMQSRIDIEAALDAEITAGSSAVEILEIPNHADWDE